MHKDVRQFLKSLKQQRWRLVPTSSNHTKAYPPEGAGFVTVPNTPSDHRTLENVKAEARAMGWHDPRRPQRKKCRR